jgi:hypothetical protein
MTNLEQYADQCAVDRVRKQIQEDFLSFVEIVEEDEELQDILKAVHHA